MSTAAIQAVLITGASGGIGNALALAYAAPGITLVLHGRDLERLSRLACLCERKGSTVITQSLDVRDTEALIAWLHDISRKVTLDLVIVNAGVNIQGGEHRRGETWADIQYLLDVNVKAALATVQAVLPTMRARGSGQIALMSSLAGYRGLPIAPSYSASKAAIRAYGEGLRDWLKPEGIKVSVIMPGYVESPMCHAMAGPKPFLWSADKAAQRIRLSLHANRARITFPFPLALGCWLLGALPPTLSGWILRRLGYGG